MRAPLLGSGRARHTPCPAQLSSRSRPIFTRPLALPPLDGVLLANALDCVRAQAAVIAQAAGYLRTGGRVLLVEYELKRGQRWVPFPVPFSRFRELAEPELIGARRSPSTGSVQYAAMARKEQTQHARDQHASCCLTV